MLSLGFPSALRRGRHPLGHTHRRVLRPRPRSLQPLVEETEAALGEKYSSVQTWHVRGIRTHRCFDNPSYGAGPKGGCARSPLHFLLLPLRQNQWQQLRLIFLQHTYWFCHYRQEKPLVLLLWTVICICTLKHCSSFLWDPHVGFSTLKNKGIPTAYTEKRGQPLSTARPEAHDTFTAPGLHIPDRNSLWARLGSGSPKNT